MGNWDNIQIETYVKGHKQTIITTDSSTNRILRKVEFIDRNGDRVFTNKEIYRISYYGYDNNIMSVHTITDTDFNGYHDRSKTSIYKKNSGGKYELLKNYKAQKTDNNDYNPNMTERAFNLYEIEFYQDEVNLKAGDVDKGLASW